MIAEVLLFQMLPRRNIKTKIIIRLKMKILKTCHEEFPIHGTIFLTILIDYKMKLGK